MKNLLEKLTGFAGLVVAGWALWLLTTPAEHAMIMKIVAVLVILGGMYLINGELRD